jgi:hypothetical protein
MKMFGADFWAIATIIQAVLKVLESLFGPKNVDKGISRHVSSQQKKRDMA